MLTQVLFQHFIGRLEIQADLRDRIGETVIPLQLLSTILQAVHPQLLIKPSFIFPMLTLHFSVVSWRRYPYPLVPYSRMEDSRIGRMEVFGDCLYFENYSNTGLLCRIEGGGVTESAEEEDLVPAKTFSGRESDQVFFYIRRTNDLLLFDLAAGELKPISLTLPDEEKIQVVFSDEDRVTIKAKTYSGLTIIKSKEKIYSYKSQELAEMPDM